METCSHSIAKHNIFSETLYMAMAWPTQPEEYQKNDQNSLFKVVEHRNSKYG